MEAKRKNQKQMVHIANRLNELAVCKVASKYSEELESISTPMVNDILQNRYTSGPPMKAINSLLDTVILSSNATRNKGLYHLTIGINKWVKKMKKIDVKSSEATVYISELAGNIQVIIKSPKSLLQNDDLLKEYFIGITAVNKLRHYVPNFMYTFAACAYPQKKQDKIVTIVEKIPGDTLEYALKNNKLTFTQFLCIFLQILLALEIAQRNVHFCHYDLHGGNIILRPIDKPFIYTIVLDTKRYDITVTDYVPVIIDFGMSTVNDESQTIGSFHFARYGMMNYMIQGADMYKLLFYSYARAKGSLQKQICDLFLFYGSDDPYKILDQKQHTVMKICAEYVKRVSFNKAATYTPLQFFKWIVKSNNCCITTSERDIYIPLSKMCTDMYQYGERDKTFAMDLALDCNSSYILLEYTKYLLKECDDVSSNTINKKLDEMSETIRKRRKTLISKDRKNLMAFTRLTLPDEMILKDHINGILSIDIKSQKDNRQLIDNFLRNVEFYRSLKPYLQFMYTIKELRLTNLFKKFILAFETSHQYLLYMKTHEEIERAVRWSITVLESKKDK